MNDEFNPHLVWNLYRDAQALDDSNLVLLANTLGSSNNDLRNIEQQENRRKIKAKRLRDRFLKLYSEACDFVMSHPQNKLLPQRIGQMYGITDFVPLAYRLDVLTTAEQPFERDNISYDKFGGLPDLRYEYDHARRSQTSLPELLRRVWPTCGCCHHKMRFLGQFDITVELWVLHHLTKRQDTSAFGSMRGERRIPSTPELYQFFFCDCNAFDNPSCDARILRQYVFETRQQPVKEPLFSDQEYVETITAFMDSHNLLRETEMGGRIPLQFVRGFKIGFDLDYGFMEDRFDYWNLRNDFNEKFGRNFRQTYTLFGEPRSQQEPMRPFSGWGNHLFRQAPIINWNDSEHDITRQMYGCFRTAGSGPSDVHCKMDNSNT